MAHTEIVIAVPPERVFEVLADGRRYGHWVVGSREIRDVEPDWPARGARLHHSIGLGPLTIRDDTRVERSEPPWRLTLRARARPLGTALVDIELRPDGAGTRVVLVEDGGDPLTSMLFLHPLTQLVTRLRNDRSLVRLKELAEGRGPSPERARRS